MSLLKPCLPKLDTIQYFCSIYFIDFGAWLFVAAKLTSLNQSGILLGKQSLLGTKGINLSLSLYFIILILKFEDISIGLRYL